MLLFMFFLSLYSVMWTFVPEVNYNDDDDDVKVRATRHALPER